MVGGKGHWPAVTARGSRETISPVAKMGATPTPTRAYASGGTPMSPTASSPVTVRAAATSSPVFGNARVRVAAAQMHGS